MGEDGVMVLEGFWRLLEAELFPVGSTPSLFNPYNGIEPELDLPGADEIRRANLLAYLAGFPRRPEMLLVGEAPGPWGCRFSGVPFTSEAQLCGGGLPMEGARSSKGDRPVREMSATIVWQAVLPHHPRVLSWNCVPLHPRFPGRPLSIRTPTGREVRDFSGLLSRAAELLEPPLVIAVGRKAEQALGLVSVECSYVRHPSQAGAALFRAGMAQLLG